MYGNYGYTTICPRYDRTVPRILKHHDIASAVRPHRNLRQILVHPNDKVEDKHKTDCVYQILCKTCNMCYIGYTGGTFGTRLDEHKQKKLKP